MDTCHICGKPANHHLTHKTGESVDLCWSCWSDWLAEHRGLRSSLYKHPKHIKVLGRTFTVHYDTCHDGVMFTAVENSQRSFYCFSCMVPFETDGMTATTELQKVIRHGLKHPSMDASSRMLQDKGFIDIFYDEDDENDLCFIIDGKPYSSQELLKILSNRESWRMEFQFNDSYLNPKNNKFIHDDPVPEDDL